MGLENEINCLRNNLQPPVPSSQDATLPSVTQNGIQGSGLSYSALPPSIDSVYLGARESEGYPYGEVNLGANVETSTVGNEATGTPGQSSHETPGTLLSVDSIHPGNQPPTIPRGIEQTAHETVALQRSVWSRASADQGNGIFMSKKRKWTDFEVNSKPSTSFVDKGLVSENDSRVWFEE